MPSAQTAAPRASDAQPPHPPRTPFCLAMVLRLLRGRSHSRARRCIQRGKHTRTSRDDPHVTRTDCAVTYARHAQIYVNAHAPRFARTKLSNLSKPQQCKKVHRRLSPARADLRTPTLPQSRPAPVGSNGVNHAHPPPCARLPASFGCQSHPRGKAISRKRSLLLHSTQVHALPRDNLSNTTSSLRRYPRVHPYGSVLLRLGIRFHDRK